MGNFVKDLATGQEAEVQVQILLNKQHPDCHYTRSDGRVKTHDLYCLFHGERVEVKRDMKALSTGNVCIEKKLLEYTRATYIVYVIGTKAYFFTYPALVKAVRELDAAGKTTKKLLGDRNANSAILVKMPDFVAYAERVEELNGE